MWQIHSQGQVHTYFQPRSSPVLKEAFVYIMETGQKIVMLQTKYNVSFANIAVCLHFVNQLFLYIL